MIGTDDSNIFVADLGWPGLCRGGLRKGSPQTPSETSIAPLRSDTLSEALVPRLALVVSALTCSVLQGALSLAT